MSPKVCKRVDTVFHHGLTEVVGATLRRDGAKYIDKILRAELGGIVEPPELGIDSETAVLAFNPGFAFRPWRQLGSPEAHFRRATGPIVHGLDRAGTLMLMTELDCCADKHGAAAKSIKTRSWMAAGRVRPIFIGAPKAKNVSDPENESELGRGGGRLRRSDVKIPKWHQPGQQ
jgi:hypothetical protein